MIYENSHTYIALIIRKYGTSSLFLAILYRFYTRQVGKYMSYCSNTSRTIWRMNYDNTHTHVLLLISVFFFFFSSNIQQDYALYNMVGQLWKCIWLTKNAVHFQQYCQFHFHYERQIPRHLQYILLYVCIILHGVYSATIVIRKIRNWFFPFYLLL